MTKKNEREMILNLIERDEVPNLRIVIETVARNIAEGRIKL